MKRLLLTAALIACVAVAGCVSKAKSREQARRAFQEGQRAATATATAAPAARVVTVLGEVRNQVVPWTEDLSLAEVIVRAQHVGLRSPRAVILRHGAEAVTLETRTVLERGHEIPVEPGDIVELVR